MKHDIHITEDQFIDDVVTFFTNIKEKYGDKSIEYLKGFKGHNILKHYLVKAYEINENDSKMDHFLFKIMKHHSLSLFNLRYYDPSDKPKDLLTSYSRSIKIAQELKNDKENVAWFSNMKLPSTYLGAPAVDKHYNDLWDALLIKNKIDVRRIHVFFEEFNLEEGYNIERSSLFTVLLLEYILGIKSRVIIIKDYKGIKEKIVSISKKQNIDIVSIFLLDFALYYEKCNSRNNHLGGNYHSLCSDFVFEDLNEIKVDIEDRIERYGKEKVYEFLDPKIYSILKYYFLSLWNKDGYVSFLNKQFATAIISEPNIKSDFIDIIKNHIEVVGFFKFWHLARAAKIEDLFIDKSFMELFPESIFHDNLKIEEFTKSIIQILKKYNLRISDKNVSIKIKGFIDELNILNPCGLVYKRY